MRRHFAFDRRLPAFQRTLIQRSIVGQSFVGNFRDQFPMLPHPHNVVTRDVPHFDRIQSPLLKHPEHFLLATFLGDQQHALLRLRQHDLVR